MNPQSHVHHVRLAEMLGDYTENAEQRKILVKFCMAFRKEYDDDHYTMFLLETLLTGLRYGNFPWTKI